MHITIIRANRNAVKYTQLELGSGHYLWGVVIIYGEGGW